MSRYRGYRKRGFANSTVAITRAASGGITSINYSGVGSTTLYLPFNDDVNDDSTSSQTITNRGSITVDSTYAKFGSKSLKSQTSGSLKIDNSVSTDFDGDGHFTIEFFIYVVTHAENTTVYTHNEYNDNYSGLLFWFGGAETLRAYASTNGSSWNLFSGSSFGVISTNTWHHVALTYDGIQYRGYLDGVGKWAVSSSTTIPTGGDHYIFSRNNGGQYEPATGAQYIDDFRITKGVALYTDSTYTVPTSALSLYVSSPVSLYLPFDSDVNDDSSRGHTVTASGDAAISSTQAKFGGNSLALDGTGDYLSSSVDAIGTDDFTIEAWVYPTVVNTYQTLFDSRVNNSTNGGMTFQITNAAKVQVYALTSSGTTNFTTTATLSANQWYHLALVRKGTGSNETEIFIDGKSAGTTAIAGELSLTSFNIGKTFDNYYFNGYIDDYRISKGVARYTKNFIPPSAAVGATLNGANETNTTTDFTALYLPFDSDVNDDSDNPFTITASGGAAISSTQAKFGGYSLGLDGTNDYLTVGSSQSAMAFAGDFTIEFWMYPTGLDGDFQGAMGCHNSSGWLFQFASGGGRFYINGSNILTTTATTSSNQWYHVAVTRNSGTVKLFIDGVEQGSLSYTSAMPTNNDLIIGASNTSGQYFPGYLDDIRILNGYAKYTADFVPPTTAVGTSVSETVNDLTTLYLPFDGTAGTASVPASEVSLYLPFDSDVNDDSSYSHTGSIGGNATISSSYSKFGGNSLYLDGSGDNVSYGDNNNFEFGSGDFTMEAWIYPTDLSHHGHTKIVLGKFSGHGSSMGFVFGVSSTNYLQFFYSASGGNVAQTFNASTTQITTNQWYHVAVTRKGNTGYLFVDGNLESTYSFTNSIANVGTSLLVGAATVYAGVSGGGAFAGYIDDVRVIKGTALYTSSFTAPTSALGTSATAPTLQGGFEDEARNHPVTKSGDVALNTSVKKFGTSSAYFDGANDYLTIPDGSFNFGDKDFTIEAWIYNTNSGTEKTLFDFRRDGSDGFEIVLSGSPNRLKYKRQINDSGTHSPNNIAATGAVGINAWKHIAIARASGTTRLFVDGTIVASGADNAPYGINNGDLGLTIGAQSNGQAGYPGYVDDLRIIIGHALYTAAFTPPTSAVGSEVVVDGSTSETYSDSKFLSGIWDMTDVRDKMMKSTWVSNDSRLPNGARLQVAGHRWYDIGDGASGGSIATPGNGYRYHVFTSPGTFTISDGAKDIEYLVVAGGGGGGGSSNPGTGAGAGGGAGGLRQGTLSAVAVGSYPVTVGTGGAGTNGLGNAGTNSVFSSITAYGGGAGGSGSPQTAGGTGGSGGGGGGDGNPQPGGSAIPGDGGNPGGSSAGPNGDNAGGGGGAGAAGGNAVQDPESARKGGGGGAGAPYPAYAGPIIAPTIPSTAQSAIGPTGLYAGGGGGSTNQTPASGHGGGPGGPGGGGRGNSPLNTQYGRGEDGVDGTGGGGGGANHQTSPRVGGDGGDGIVILRYTY